ncbi:molybdenum cofactor cytidylyltransferase [Roseovarius azorensis]|uniref:Molybdenum cofactor cytidylyltransferase n=1 Tax=Roseovarius azorensis TaxID=1287727 RepID=A0A1H7LUT1_9RHOB|nr:molybdopterin-binding protein [Roseovarius azorensis]SEL02265.1 molybdenum cofactor cytidylyltransferase [Roseovarius azorensis]
MKFGPVPLDQAEGAILAHSEQVAGGRLRKGAVLGTDQIGALRAAGYAQVTVARLETGDLHEDRAAEMLAQALRGTASGIAISAPFTGRVNLLAERPGVVCLDTGAINAANAVDPMITVATVPDHHQIRAGGMIATVKIIAYGVSGAALARAADLARGAVRLAVAQYRNASLIITDTPGGPGDKGAEAIAARVTGLGMEMAETVICAHEEAALADAIGAARGDIVLILTASATSDPHDTAPQALRRAGGQVERFGMPVDPGNLLFLGSLGGKPVIGLPGSARSPVLHGADWVLARVACGLPCGAAEIAAMGVGGLLKEIPTRPQPRSAGRR